MSANCVVFTNYSSGDAAAEVDEHFSRALGSISKQQVRKTLLLAHLIYHYFNSLISYAIFKSIYSYSAEYSFTLNF
jgi:hypothetical protein